jgi:hypothetical protein
VYEGLFEADTSIGRMLGILSCLKARQARLPEMLLGALSPLRAFVGHVEPTFDCTMRVPATGQQLTRSILDALYDGLCSGDPVGYAFRDCFANLTSLGGLWERARRRFDRGGSFTFDDLAVCLMACDWRTLVILGDPTVCLPKGS